MKLASLAAASPWFSGILAWGEKHKLTNWAGNLEYDTERLYSATDTADVRRFAKANTKFKVLGTKHCFNDIANTGTEFLSVRSQDKVVDINAKNKTVTIEAGMSYGQLAPFLDQHGFALHNLASLPHISVAGACTTATHGSGEKNGNLATQVSAIELVTASGDALRLSREKDGEVFRGVVVGLGALGVITRLTLDVQPTFTMKQYVYENLPLSELKESFATIESSAYSVSLFTDWQKQRVNEVWLKVREDAEPKFDAF